MSADTTPCAGCGMPCTPREYHPYAACLMFKACHNSDTVRANLATARAPAAAPQGPTDAEIEAMRESFDWEGYTDQRVAQRAFARAVLARWGAPAASGEPVARKPLTRSQIAAASREAQIQFCLDKQPTYEVALARAIEAAHGIKP